MWAMAVLGIVAIIAVSVITIVKIALKHEENIERIKHGYPTTEEDSKEQYHN